ncbi:hypothetical protein LPB67_12960 [Undibacterium sp. Jales W-56]|uniref:hypothetical protein n=1 Tax=Undibacterium sp. Jales W-56 TaxID=2897325 RepID=UPI0021CF93CD|nr:hypothetical protein [Undibacterium sp. Jales W-56]MCU6434680.1 hypothetical protein [Undibacterium sp. Jales W-56]
MKIIRYTLLADGSSDAMLIPIIDWVIRKNFPTLNFQSQFARDLGQIGLDLQRRLVVALEQFPCDVLFVHRDVENQSYADRMKEISSAVNLSIDKYVPIIPIRMTEAWLLSDEMAIRAAAGNRNGKVKLSLPPKNKWEVLANPKEILFDALLASSEKTGRALAKFNPHLQRARVTELTEDFSTLQGLSSFDAFETETILQFRKF